MADWTSDETARIGTAEELDVTRLRRDGEPTSLRRRSFLRGALTGVAGIVLGTQMSGCSVALPGNGEAEPERGPDEPSSTGSNVLLAYFSRAGENYYYGGRTDLTVGNTEVLAGMISRLTVCDVHRIEPVEPYSDDYSETVERNVREQAVAARPAIANPLASIERYGLVLLGSPIWNVRAPMIMSRFAESLDFSGKIVVPFTTHAGSGLGTTARDYAASCPGATLGEGLAVRGEEVGSAGPAVESWLRRIGLFSR